MADYRCAPDDKIVRDPFAEASDFVLTAAQIDGIHARLDDRKEPLRPAEGIC